MMNDEYSIPCPICVVGRVYMNRKSNIDAFDGHLWRWSGMCNNNSCSSKYTLATKVVDPSISREEATLRAKRIQKETKEWVKEHG